MNNKAINDVASEHDLRKWISIFAIVVYFEKVFKCIKRINKCIRKAFAVWYYICM